jgi:hypothetical protein
MGVDTPDALTLRQSLSFSSRGLLNTVRAFHRCRNFAASLESALIELFIEGGGGGKSDCDLTKWERNT